MNYIPSTGFSCLRTFATPYSIYICHFFCEKNLCFDQRGRVLFAKLWAFRIQTFLVALQLRQNFFSNIRTIFLLAQNVCCSLPFLSQAALFFDPEMSFSRPRIGPSCFRPRHVFFDLQLFQPAMRPPLCIILSSLFLGFETS